MKVRVALMIAMACGGVTAVQAQEYIRVSYQSSEVVAGTTTPATQFIGQLDPGESLKLQVTLTLIRNGTSAIGQTTTYTSPSPGGVGTIAGIGSFIYNLYGLNNATGTWYGRSVSGILASGSSTGTVSNGGALISNIQGTQFVFPGMTANATNPIVGAFTGFWTPSSYAERWVYFQMQPGSASGVGQHNSEVVKYGVDAGSGNPLYTYKYLETDFGLGIDINVGIPTPSSAMLLGMGLFGLSKRRRTGCQPVP